MIAYQISNLPNTPFRFFANKSYIFENFMEDIFFFGSYYSFAPVKTCFDNFRPKFAKNRALLLQVFEISN